MPATGRKKVSTPGKTGRPTKLTPRVRSRVLRAVRNGNYIETAVLAAGISKGTFYGWLNRGKREKSGIYRDFLYELGQAEAIAERRGIDRIARAGKIDWRAEAWRLSRKKKANLQEEEPETGGDWVERTKTDVDVGAKSSFTDLVMLSMKIGKGKGKGDDTDGD